MADDLSPYDRLARDARRAVAIAVRDGRLTRETCRECDVPGEAHHDQGYDPGHWLDVIWLCRSHHAARHFQMHRQWSAVKAEKTGSFGLQALRLMRGMTQVELAEAMGIAQSNVSAIEGRTDMAVSTLREYVEALGGRLEVAAIFDDERQTIAIG